jgi:flagellar motor switch/type III secretory pathway protein FliN
MAALHPLPATATGQPHVPAAPVAEAAQAEQALVPFSPQQEEDEGERFPAPVMRLPVELDVSVPAREFRVRNLLALAPGKVIETQWAHGEDVPLASGNVQLAWSEFEVVETQLAVRVTRLA